MSTKALAKRGKGIQFPKAHPENHIVVDLGIWGNDYWRRLFRRLLGR